MCPLASCGERCGIRGQAFRLPLVGRVISLGVVTCLPVTPSITFTGRTFVDDSGEPAFGPRAPLGVEAACELVVGAHARAVILVEGWSDQAALESLAVRRGRDLATEGIAVVPMGGITNIGKFAQALGPRGLGILLAGLCDAAEERYVARSLHGMGLGGFTREELTREDAEALGFFVCEADLEDELIRAVGTEAVERVLEAEGELASFRRFQDQPAQRGRSAHVQL